MMPERTRSSTRIAVSNGFAAAGVLLFVSAGVSPAEWLPGAQLFTGIAFLAVSHVLTPCEGYLSQWWKNRIAKRLHR